MCSNCSTNKDLITHQFWNATLTSSPSTAADTTCPSTAWPRGAERESAWRGQKSSGHKGRWASSGSAGLEGSCRWAGGPGGWGKGVEGAIVGSGKGRCSWVQEGPKGNRWSGLNAVAIRCTFWVT